MASGYNTFENENAEFIKQASLPPYQLQGSQNPTIQSPAALPPYQYQNASNAPPSYQGASQRQLQAGRPDTVIVYRQVVYGQEPCTDRKIYRLLLLALLFFFPFGLVACVKISEMNDRLSTGDREGANRSATQAKYWSVASLCVGLVAQGIAAVIILCVFN